MYDYTLLKRLCQGADSKIPRISIEKSSQISNRLKRNVHDFYGISASHYLNAGQEGLNHFQFLLNYIITDLGISSLSELNTVHSRVLYKQHGKNKNSDRSYRSISTCIFLSKAIDLYIRDLCIDQWNNYQAGNQFQGAGMSHELAALLITETIQYASKVNKRPIFLLSLDAQSAYDKIIPEIFVKDLFNMRTNEQIILYLDQKLKNRLTYYEWNKILMGPTLDNIGFEQGGIGSSDYYKIYSKSHLSTTQASKLGTNLGSSVVSSVGLADDTILVSDDIHNLQCLLHLINDYCHYYKVNLVPSKTKLICIGSKKDAQFIEYLKLINPINVCGTAIEFCDELQHVGVIRSTLGNMPAVLDRITAQKRAVGAVLSAGLRRGHLKDP